MESLQQLWTAVCAFATAPTLQHMYDVMNGFNTLVWGPPMIIILLFLGIYFTIRLHFLQKYTWPAMKLSVKKVESEGMVSSFGSLAVMIGATVGTGSIIGVTTAVAEGGPGALFWMVVAGFFNFAIKYCECMVAFKYRVRLPDGEYGIILDNLVCIDSCK